MATNAQAMVEILEDALRRHPVGVVTVNVDGVSVQYDRRQAIEELAMWRRTAAQESGSRPLIGRIDFGGRS